jgi:hypothetical protein
MKLEKRKFDSHWKPKGIEVLVSEAGLMSGKPDSVVLRIILWEIASVVSCIYLSIFIYGLLNNAVKPRLHDASWLAPVK